MPTQMVASCDVIEMWENAGVTQAKKLFKSLGFDDDLVSISHLSNALEEELRNSSNEPESSLLKASLVLQKTEVIALKQAFRQLVEENKKLHTDNRDVNRRAALLAQEIDERHATLENTTKSEIRMLEQRHAEVIREITAQLANDRENWSNLNARLEARIKSLEIDETRYKSDLQSIQNENCALENEQISFQKQITELLETNIKLNNEIVELEDRQRSEDGCKGDKETEEVLELIDKVTSLQIENANLRDKNDELVAEIEGLNMELGRYKNKKSTSRSNLEILGDNLSDDPEHSSLAVKRRGDSPSKTRITEESPRLGKLRKCSNDNSESETSGDWVALNSELGQNLNSATTTGFSQNISGVSEETQQLKEKISKLEKELNEYRNGKIPSSQHKSEMPETDKEKLELRCQELESSLEQMRKAYDDCEDYWASKLNEERQLLDKERQIYADEQHESDKKFTELMEKVREYEEQYSKDGRLSPIEERDNLEQQYIDLETEAEEIKENAKNMLEEKTKEICRLQEQIQDLQMRLGVNIETIASNHLVATDPSEICSPASSPICYLWNQSTIQAPTRDYHNPNWDSKPKKESGLQRDNDETASNVSARSCGSHSVASTHSVHKSIGDCSSCPSPNIIKEELKRLKYVEVQLKEQISNLALNRDSLVMELQQLQEAKPVLEKAYARAAHPTLLQRVNHLEQKNRHLQTVLRQQQQYTESILHQTWQQHRAETTELRNRLETQSKFLSEQAQRLANADLLVKDLYVENSHLTATIQRLEQQRSRANIMQHQHQGLSGVPGMP